MFSQATLLLGLSASATAHMIMNYPVPYGKASLNSSPLAPGDFPCKQRPGVYDVTEMNQWNAGETKTISFTGSAVHGGGSCQFSLTTDPKPSESSQWKVIKSVVGGCPSNVTGNLEPADPNGHGAATFPVEMPNDIPDGQYTFAWTWLNKVGNREFYMNCAPIQVGSGGAAKASTKSVSAALSSLPDMFVANLPATECSTDEDTDFNYPEPGKNVVEEHSAALSNKVTGSGCSKVTKMGAGSGQLGAPQPGGSESGGSQPNASQPAVSSPADSSPPAATSGYAALPPNNGGVFAPGASSAAPSPTPAPVAPKPSTPEQQPSTPQQPAAPEQPASSPAPQTPQTPDNGTSAPSGGADCHPCTNDGGIVCIGTSQFGLCNHGCAVAQPLANGMSCSGGAVVASTKTKRSVKFPRAHLHRRHSASHFL